MIQSSQGEMKFSGSRERRVIEVSVTITTRKVSPHEETHFSRDSVLKKGRNTTEGGGRGKKQTGRDVEKFQGRVPLLVEHAEISSRSSLKRRKRKPAEADDGVKSKREKAAAGANQRPRRVFPTDASSPGLR